MITNVKLVTIRVSDQDRALDFYTNKLGFQVLEDQAYGPGMRWLELAPPGSHTRVTLFNPEGHESQLGAYSGISFQCDDVQSTFEALAAKGVRFTQEPAEQPGGLMAVFADPDGNTFVLGKD